MADDLATRDARAGGNGDLRQMAVAGLQAAAMLEIDEDAITANPGAASDDARAFTGEYAEALRAAYPPEPDGRTLFPFRRLFVVAAARG